MASTVKAGNWFIRISPKDATRLERSSDGKNWSALTPVPAKCLDLEGKSNGDCIIETDKGRMIRTASGNVRKY